MNKSTKKISLKLCLNVNLITTVSSSFHIVRQCSYRLKHLVKTTQPPHPFEWLCCVGSAGVPALRTIEGKICLEKELNFCQTLTNKALLDHFIKPVKHVQAQILSRLLFNVNSIHMQINVKKKNLKQLTSRPVKKYIG